MHEILRAHCRGRPCGPRSLSFFLSFFHPSWSRFDVDIFIFCVRTSRPITTTIAAARSFFLFFSIRQLCCEGSRCASKVAISTFFCLFVFLFYLEWSGSSGSTPPFGTGTFGFFFNLEKKQTRSRSEYRISVSFLFIWSFSIRVLIEKTWKKRKEKKRKKRAVVIVVRRNERSFRWFLWFILRNGFNWVSSSWTECYRVYEGSTEF